MNITDFINTNTKDLFIENENIKGNLCVTVGNFKKSHRTYHTDCNSEYKDGVLTITGKKIKKASIDHSFYDFEKVRINGTDYTFDQFLNMIENLEEKDEFGEIVTVVKDKKFLWFNKKGYRVIRVPSDMYYSRYFILKKEHWDTVEYHTTNFIIEKK